MAESAGYQAEQAAEQDQGGGGFRAWFVAHERTVLIVGLVGIGVTIFLFWRGKGSSQAGSNTVPGSGGIPTASLADSSTTQALNNLTQAISNLLGQLGGSKAGGGGGGTGGGGGGGGGTGGGGTGGGGGGGGIPTFADFLRSLGISSQFYGLSVYQQGQGQAIYSQRGAAAFINWLRMQTQGGIGPGPLPGPPPTRTQATPQLVAPTLPAMQQQHYPLGALAPRPVLPANAR